MRVVDGSDRSAGADGDEEFLNIIKGFEGYEAYLHKFALK